KLTFTTSSRSYLTRNSLYLSICAQIGQRGATPISWSGGLSRRLEATGMVGPSISAKVCPGDDASVDGTLYRSAPFSSHPDFCWGYISWLSGDALGPRRSSRAAGGWRSRWRERRSYIKE